MRPLYVDTPVAQATRPPLRASSKRRETTNGFVLYALYWVLYASPQDAAMLIANPQNLHHPTSSALRPYGIRVSLPRADTFTLLVGSDWQTVHWFESAVERDRALADMAREHEYSRAGDRPTPVLEAIQAP